MSTLSTTNLKNPSSGSNNIVLGADGSVTVSALQGGITSATAVASTSGTSIDFTGIPSWVKRVTVMFNGVSTNGTSVVLLQIGTSSGVATSGYLGAAGDILGATVANFTTGCGTQSAGNATHVRHGSIRFSSMTGNVWAAEGIVAASNGTQVWCAGSSVTLSGTLDRVRITTVNGTDTFDAGSINILYEG